MTIALLTFFLINSPANAAKENFDRSKPHKLSKKGLDNDCDLKSPDCKRKMKKLMMEKKRLEMKTKSRDYNSSRSNRSENSVKAADQNRLLRMKKEKKSKIEKVKNSKATDYNSSRSNKNSKKPAQMDDNEDDNKKDDN